MNTNEMNYVANDEMKKNLCPKCGREITNWCETTMEENYLDCQFTCECGATGVVQYELQYHSTVAWDN